jgi:LysR family glycine cleavage system transcriptional activator
MSNLRSLPPLDSIRGFVAVCRRKSISLAAQDLCLTQSAVSRQIQALEERLGVPLFIRRHRAIELTDAGEQLVQLCGPWLDGLAAFTELVQRKGGLRPVTVSASVGVTSLWLLPRLGSFQAAHPSIDVRVAANNRVLDLKLEGIDLSIRYCNTADAPPGAQLLFGEQVVAVASKAVAERAFASPDGIFGEVLLDLDDKGRPWLSWAERLSALGLSSRKPRAYLHFNQYDQMIQAAMEGHGIALGRVPLVLPMLRDGRLQAQPHGVFDISDVAYFLLDAEPECRREVQVFRDWIMAEVARDKDLAALPVTVSNSDQSKPLLRSA